MLLPRIIPCLLITNGGLAKTTNFKNPKYVGDPINAVKIFNEKEVDEIMVIDIDATINSKEPDYDLISNLAAECRMPLCYGGGVKTTEQIKKIISLGVEKIALSSAIIDKPEIIKEAASLVGSQSIVFVMDVKQRGILKKYEIYTHNGTKKTDKDPIKLAKIVEEYGAGEIVINSIDRDGTMKGYDHDIIKQVRNSINLPITVIGGCGSIDDIKNIISQFGIIGAAAGSMFVFKGKYRAVLINYPTPNEKEEIYSEIK